MNLTITKEKFSRLLYLASTIVERRNTMPILANVRLTAENGVLSLAATDLEISLMGEAEADIKTPGSITVGAKVLYEIVRELPASEVTLRAQKGQRLEVEAGQSKFKINGTAAEEFPAIVGTQLKNPISVEAAKVYEMLEKTAFAVSTDETRYNINGVFIETVKNGNDALLRFVATDGHRLALVDRPADGLSVEKGVIIPRKAITEIKKLLEGNEGAAQVGINEGFFTVRSEGVTMGVRLVDGQFPDYRQVIPNESSTEVSLNKVEFIAAVKRVSLVTTDKSKTIKFKLQDGNLVISSSSPEYGEASETLPVTQKGGDTAIGFSARYVSDLLAAMPHAEMITLRLNGELGPGVFRGDDDDFYTTIVMPMRFE